MNPDLDPRSAIRKELIAPCGMNCAVCMGRLLRDKNPCPGCRGEQTHKSRNCQRCVIANCEYFKKSGSLYCPEDCPKYPCKRLQALDQRYRTKYAMSMLENLRFIQVSGSEAFVENERERWTCQVCGAITCVHRSACTICGAPR